jgi:hypothetical protein
MYWQLDSRARGNIVPSRKLEYRFKANRQRIQKNHQG